MPEMDKKNPELTEQPEEIIEDIPAERRPAAPQKAAAAQETAQKKQTAQAKPAVKKAASAQTAKPVQKSAEAAAQKNLKAEVKKSEPAAKKPKSADAQAKKPVKAAELKKAVRESVIEEENGCLEEETKPISAVMELINGLREKWENRPKKPPLSEKAQQRRRRRRKKFIWKMVRRSILCLFTALIVLVFGAYMVLFTVFNGPSQTVADLTVNTMLETSALKFVPRLFYTEDEVQEIIARNSIEVPDVATNTDMVVINRDSQSAANGDGTEQKDIEIVDVAGPTYRGYMMIVKDPSRVRLAVCDPEFDSDYGKFIDEMARDEGAVAAINAGGFEDEGGSGKGGKPLGIVIKDGEVLNSSTSGSCSIVIGFDQEDKLIVGKLTAKEAVELGMRDAASFGPVLVLNGEPAQVKGSSSGLNPRTAIGQRADGAVLMLVIDGRQANSLGASMADLIDVMMQFGAVNAANLDGGSSSKMYYQGEFINDGVALTGSRRLPTVFIVK